MADDEPKRLKMCNKCGTNSYRHFYIGDSYKFTLCTNCRNGLCIDGEINLTYVKKACAHFRRLVNVMLNNEGLKSKKKYKFPVLHSRDDFFRPVARYENFFDLDAIKNHIKNIWAEKFETVPNLIKYDPISTFGECVEFALSRKKLKSKWVASWKQYDRNRNWDESNAWMYARYFYKDFDFHVFKGDELYERKQDVYPAKTKSYITLQALFRGYIVRKKANDQLRMKSAVVIQASWRKKNAMRLLKKHKQYAVKIQALFRGYYVRRPYGIYMSWAFWNLYTAPPQL